MKLYEQKIKKILSLLESSVDINVDTQALEACAIEHLANYKKILEIEKKITKLLAQKTELEDANDVINDDILDIIGNTKSQSFRFGKILVEFKVTRDSGITRSAPSWKKIVDELVRTKKVEQKIVDDLSKSVEFNSGNKEFTNVNKDLSIQQEAKQLKEGLGDSLKTIWLGFRSVFSKLFRSFKSQNDHLESLLQSIK
ncbi:MAG: hypothetical protein ABIP51_10075 [Bacteroidia bacterium]